MCRRWPGSAAGSRFRPGLDVTPIGQQSRSAADLCGNQTVEALPPSVLSVPGKNGQKNEAGRDYRVDQEWINPTLAGREARRHDAVLHVVTGCTREPNRRGEKMKLVAMVTIGFLGALRRKASQEEAKVIYHPL